MCDPFEPNYQLVLTKLVLACMPCVCCVAKQANKNNKEQEKKAMEADSDEEMGGKEATERNLQREAARNKQKSRKKKQRDGGNPHVFPSNPQLVLTKLVLACMHRNCCGHPQARKEVSLV